MKKKKTGRICLKRLFLALYIPYAVNIPLAACVWAGGIWPPEGAVSPAVRTGLLAVGLREHWDLEQLPSIARGKRGKPLFPDFPQLRFNLSHSGPRALCALDRDEVGVDIQQITLRRSAFLDRLLSPEERAWLLGLGDDPEAFTQLWTLKESFCKFTGLGLTRPISAIPVPLPRQILPSGACLPFGSVCFTLFSGPGWRAAVCSPARCASSIRWLTPGQLPPVGKKIPQK